MLIFLLTIIPTLATATLLIPNPLSLAIIILTIAITTALLIALLISSWIAFLLFLIYIGGILVIFAYFVATSPNFPINIKIPLTIRFFIFSVLLYLLQNTSPQIVSIKSSSLNTFYSTHTTSTLIILALILLLTIIIVVKLVSLPKGPLRPFI